MKKVFPLLLFVFLAFSSCQKGPVMYTPAEKPAEVVANAEKFVKQTEKRSLHCQQDTDQQMKCLLRVRLQICIHGFCILTLMVK
jgi:predicted small lipoprotein YifL